jgi:hypothetical protein
MGIKLKTDRALEDQEDIDNNSVPCGSFEKARTATESILYAHWPVSESAESRSSAIFTASIAR